VEEDPLDALAEPTSEVIEPLAEAETELARCLRLLTPLFGDHEFRDSPPEVRIEDGYAPLPGEPFGVLASHRVTLYARGDLNRPVEQVLTILLHKAVHVFNAFHWVGDCSRVSYHTRRFREVAERVGFMVHWVNARYGWAETAPSPLLMRIFGDLAVAEEALRPFRRGYPRLRWPRIWHCGLPRFPDRAQLQELLASAAGGSGPKEVSYGFAEGRRMKVEVRSGELRIEARPVADGGGGQR
jgi:hypothetical protein